MKIEKLVRMANQIATFFHSYSEDKALEGIHDHIEAFWTPSMRDTLLAYARQDGAELDPLVTQSLLRRGTGASPIEKGTAGPEKLGQLVSDAG